MYCNLTSRQSNNKNKLNPAWSLTRDLQFYTAILAGVFAWLLLYIYQQPDIDWKWPYSLPLDFLSLVILIPVIEEIVFRGLLQDFIKKNFFAGKFGPVSYANLITSLIFSGLHIPFHSLPWALLVLAPSLIFGYFKDRSGSLLAPIILHVFYNFGYFWLFTTPQI